MVKVVEQMEWLEVRWDGFEVSMQGPERRERIRIVSPYPSDIYSKSLFAWLGAMHLIAPYLPRTIRTNFVIPLSMRELVDAMYRWDGAVPPRYENPDIPPTTFWSPLRTSRKRVAIAYSAGKDSLWNLWRAMEQYGADNVLVAHIRNLNKNNGSNEVEYVKKQQKCFGFKHLEVIELINSSLNTGYQTMRSRDMFLAGVLAPLAVEFGAGQIITEGFAEEAPREPFSGQEWNMLYFNSILERLHIPVRMNWKNRKEMDVIKDLYRHRPEWMPHVCNCFTIPRRHKHLRKIFRAGARTFPLYLSQCGVCVKCKITNVARLLYDPLMQKTNPEDVKYFLRNTARWMREPDNSHDMITKSFMRDFRAACRRYGISLSS